MKHLENFQKSSHGNLRIRKFPFIRKYLRIRNFPVVRKKSYGSVSEAGELGHRHIELDWFLVLNAYFLEFFHIFSETEWHLP